VTGDGAVDMWALGVVAFELLTRTRAFTPLIETHAQVRDKLLGATPLPWEDPATAPELLPSLRALKRSVLACLARDPTSRPSSREVLGSWNGLLEAETASASARVAVAAAPSAAQAPVARAPGQPAQHAGGALAGHSVLQRTSGQLVQ
jgi:serine/threonine protein kinase